MAVFVDCANKRIWFGAVARQQLRPDWNTPIQGVADPLPDAAPEATGAITVALSDRNLSDTYRGFVDLTVENLSLGQTILLERFLVDNPNGTINPEAILIDSRLITDGYLPYLGDEPNYNETLDYVEIEFEAVTERDGVIITYFPIRGGLESIPGEYVYRVSSPLGSFAPVGVQLTIDETSSDQAFEGRVMNGTTPVPGALVGILESLGASSHVRQVTRADQNGNYRIHAPFEDEFDLVAIAPGFVGPLTVGTGQIITEGETVNRNLHLTPGNRTMSGTVIDSASGKPVAGLPVTFVTVDNDGRPTGERCTHTWTNASGQFSVSVTPELWGITFKASDVSSRSYLAGWEKVSKVVNTTETDQTDLQVALTKGNSLIWGTLIAPNGTTIEGVEVFAYNEEEGTCASGVTYEDGTFFLAVTPGHWSVFPFSYDLEVVEQPGSYETDVYLPAEDQSIEVTFVARPMGGILEGRVLMPNSDPVGKLRLVAFNQDRDYRDTVIQSTYASDGYYSFYLSPGSWAVYPDSDQAASQQLLFDSLPTMEVPAEGDPFTANTSVEDIHIIAQTGIVELMLIDTEGQPVSGVKMHGASDSGQHAFARTDEEGLAYLPVIDGNWQIHLSSENLRLRGKRELPMIDVTVSGPTTTLQRTAIDFDDSRPIVTGTELREETKFFVKGRGEPGQRYTVEGTRDLKNWTVLGRLLALDGEFSILDSPIFRTQRDATTTESAFYRLLSETAKESMVE